ncbi:heat-shock protein (plasmid) [Candidatus Pantoea edessiphila]|uniref:Heat-shock protein n=1 Tax=Candidatus Pantoea edessiphila TaxID=2044610 RepID=A0A2P5SZ85_9GAMM|nr:Hsp20 family protein [Candidatus Pantoea edessiphila]PPI87620.1 heat-shock protein [Candidatus Pantoea edessiphila]
MSYRSFSLMPSFSNNLFSDRFTQMDNLFSRITGEKPLMDTPSYNLLQKDKDNYELVISVPGYSQNELDISILNNQLTISGKLSVSNTGKNELNKNELNKDKFFRWLHQGIKRSDFSLSFNLEHRININYSVLCNGLLILRFTYDIPEREKPQKVSIGLQNDLNRVIEHHGS